MQQQMLVLILNVLVLSCFIVRTESSSIISKINKKNGTPEEFPKIGNNSACGTRAPWFREEKNVASVAAATKPTVRKWPWVASIYYMDPSDNKRTKLYGTASIITNRHLITVAQVVSLKNTSFADPSNFFAVVGGAYGEQGLLYNIQNIFIYSLTSEEQPNLEGMAIVQLANAMTLTDYVQPICLPKMEGSYGNNSLIAIGWGYSTDNFTATQVLYEVDVPILPKEFCQQYIPGMYPADKLMCGKQSKETICKINNGGPLMSREDGKFTIVGLTDNSVGRPCGNPEIPIYFIKVASYMEWIKNIILNSF